MKFKTVQLVIGVALALGAAYLITSPWHGSPQPDAGDHQTGSSSLASGETVSQGMAESADKVGFKTKWHTKATPNHLPSLSLTLNIARGWHVNAHPASLEFLIPTTASATVAGQKLKLDARYPAGVDSGIQLSGKPVLVYDNGTRILLSPAKAAWPAIREAGHFTVRLRVQSCSDKGVCLAPSLLSQVVAVPKRTQG